MQTLEIKVPEDKTLQVIQFLKELSISVKVKKGNVPNAETIAAMEQLKSGKGIKFRSVEELFKNI